MSSKVLTGLATACLMLNCACSPFEKVTEVKQFQSVIPEQTEETVSNGITNIVYIASVTNIIWVTNTLVRVHPKIDQTISTLQSVNTLNPTPSQPVIGYALAGLSGLLAWIAKKKNDKASLLDVVISGVESSKNKDVKEDIRKASELWGKAKDLHKAVKEITR